MSLSEAKAHLRVEHNDEDERISALVTAARQRLEDYCRRGFLRQRWRALITGDVCAGLAVSLPRGTLTDADPVVLEYLSAAETWTEHAGFRVIREDSPASLHFRAPLPASVLSQPGEPVWRVSYWTGYGDNPGDVPHPIRTAILMLAGHLYEHRQPVERVEAFPVPMGIEFLLTPYVVPWMGCM